MKLRNGAALVSQCGALPPSASHTALHAAWAAPAASRSDDSMSRMPAHSTVIAFVLLFASAVFAQTAGAPATKASSSIPDRLADEQLVFRSAADAVAKYTVRIETIGGAQPVQTGERGGEKVAEATFRQADGPTTGVIWSNDGLIITSSFNFIRDPSIITVSLHDGRRFVAKLVARDKPARLALLKIDATDLPTPTLLREKDLRVGQWMLTAGFGMGSEQPAISVGIVSALERSNGLTVQTDAKTSPANYGGPLFDLEGRVAGVCVPMGQGMDEIAGVDWYDSGIGFAASVERIEQHLTQLRAGHDVERGFIGVALAPREVALPADTAKALGTPSGQVVVGAPRGPAIEAGLAAGDIITHLDEIATPQIAGFRKVLWRKGAADTIAVRYVRDGKPHDVKIVLARQNDFAEPEKPTPKPAEAEHKAEPDQKDEKP